MEIKYTKRFFFSVRLLLKSPVFRVYLNEQLDRKKEKAGTKT